MAYLRVEGGIRLNGSVAAAGSKNGALPLLAAAMLLEGETVLRGVPRVSDIETFRAIMAEVGVDSAWTGRDTLVIAGGHLTDRSPTLGLVRKMRASYYVMGPLLGMLGRSVVGLPGGCSIGSRPVDLHLAAFEALGATVRTDGGVAQVEAGPTGLRGASMDLLGPFGSSVGATINAMLAAVLTPGVTTIRSAAMEPDVIETAAMLNLAGARIAGAGTRTIEIEGVKRLGAVSYAVAGDRIESGTYLLAAAATGGDVTVTGIRPWHLSALPDLLRKMGCKVTLGEEEVRVVARERLRAVQVETGTFPALATDLQPQLVAALCRAEGASMVGERIFDGRFEYTRELERLGAHIRVAGNTAVISGVERLSGAPVVGKDLRGTAALVIGAMAAQGESTVEGLQYLDRGYEGFEEKMRSLGARIERVEPAFATRKY